MRVARNIKYVESGDDIRSLPSLNAAEAAERIPGVSTERDEGEGKFVQIRGTEPKLSAVSIDGTPIPGTLNGDRSVKLDDVPSDILGAIEVSKTLSADQDASGIGGTVNLVTKVPESAPRGYISALLGSTTIDAGTAGQGSFTYGGRVGEDKKLGFLLGARRSIATTARSRTSSRSGVRPQRGTGSIPTISTSATTSIAASATARTPTSITGSTKRRRFTSAACTAGSTTMDCATNVGRCIQRRLGRCAGGASPSIGDSRFERATG